MQEYYRLNIHEDVVNNCIIITFVTLNTIPCAMGKINHIATVRSP